MSFSTDLAELVAGQLSRFVTLKPHQLAGQVANLDFWLSHVRHAIETIDGYGVRFVRMEGGQERYVAANFTTDSEYNPAAKTSHERTPSPPRRISDRELQKARRALLDSTVHFLTRCRDAGLISNDQLFAAGNSVGIEPETLRRH